MTDPDREDLYYRVFYNADRTIGLFPTATYTTGFGVAAAVPSNLPRAARR